MNLKELEKTIESALNELLSLTKTTEEKENKSSLLEKPSIPSGGSVKTDVIKLPQLRLSDNWGKPGNEDRSVVERLMRNIGKRGSTPFERISAVNSFIVECDKSCRDGLDTSKIISNLMFLDVLSSLTYEFNPSTGGYLFESFFAALFGGQARAVPTGSGTIADIIATDDEGKDVPMSLKFFEGGKIVDVSGESKKKGSSYVGGSLYDLIKSISPGKPMTYVLVRKMKSKSDSVDEVLFYKFTVGTIAGIKRGGSTSRPQIISELVEADFMMGRDYDVESTDYEAEGDEPKPVRSQRGYKKGIYGNDFKITIPQITKYMEPVAKLKFGGEKYLKDLAKSYTELLEKDVVLAFNALNALTKNLTVYYADDAGKGAALQNAEKNVEDLKTSVSGIKSSKQDS
jgi:hypothetical protein